jgi:tetratricopeptide (TPR) repeat protein
VARAVAAKVKGRLSEREQEALTETRTIDPAAYRAYLKGVAQLETWGLMGVWWRAEDLLATAVTLEPGFAPAWAELARTYCWLRWFHPEKSGWMLTSTNPTIVGALENQTAMARALGLSPEAWYPQLARAAAARALALDPDLATAHTVEGMLAWMFDQDWDAAEQSFQRAVRFAPGNSFVRRQYANYLCVDGRCDQAATEARQAVQLSPLSLAAQREHAILLMNCRRFDEADAAVTAALPTYASNRDVYLFWVFRMHMAIWQDRPGDVAAFADSVTAHTTTGRLAAPGLWYLGRQDEAWELMGGREDYQPSATSAYLLMLEGRKQEAMDLIEQWAGESPAYGMVTMLDPYFDPLHDDPRWRAVAESLQMRRYLQ